MRKLFPLTGAHMRHSMARMTALVVAIVVFAALPASGDAGMSSGDDSKTSGISASATPSPTLVPASVGVDASVPDDISAALRAVLGPDSSLPDGRGVEWVEQAARLTNHFGFAPLAQAGEIRLAERTYAVVAAFATVRDEVGMAELRARWSGVGDSALLVAAEAAAPLSVVFGGLPARTVPAAELLARLRQTSGALGILPFDLLEPTAKVLAVDGVNPLSNQFPADRYPLTVALTLTGAEAPALAPLWQHAIAPVANRDPGKLTTLIMTGVTAMSRMTAQRMERKGYDYPAQVIGPTLRQADITHVSNEVPFVPGCRVNASANNLRFCSDTTYWAALEAIGVDIVGLSGNHVNDFGRKGARQSLAFYVEKGAGIYGSGLNEEAACRPLLIEHNGNTFAFIAALAYYPRSAWATATEPGACYYYTNHKKILDMVRQFSDQVDVVAVELQHYERYNPRPTPKQVQEFRELRRAGADIVTGVQSHVPQAIEPYGADSAAGPGIILYGLGNLFFDQMWSWQTRTGLIVRHAVYEGRLISTEVLTTVLVDYAQPRWASTSERASLLRRIFAAAPPAPAPPTP